MTPAEKASVLEVPTTRPRRRASHRALPTRAGLFLFGAPLVLGVAAVTATNNLLLMLLGAALGTIVLSGVFSERNIRRVRARVRAVGHVYAGEPARVGVELERDDGTDAYGLRVHERVRRRWWRRWSRPEGLLDVTVGHLLGGRGRAIGSRTFPHRGRARLWPLELVTTFPFGLLFKSRQIPEDVEIWVRPRRIDVAPALAEPGRRIGEGEVSRRRGQGLEIYGLRERQEHEALHRVHALRSLALGREVVLDTASVERPTAWLGVALDEDADPTAVERALEHAQAALIRWERRGYAVGVCTATEVHPPGDVSLDVVLDALARAEPGPPPAIREPPAVWLVPTGARAPATAQVRWGVAADGTLTERSVG